MSPVHLKCQLSHHGVSTERYASAGFQVSLDPGSCIHSALESQQLREGQAGVLTGELSLRCPQHLVHCNVCICNLCMVEAQTSMIVQQTLVAIDVYTKLPCFQRRIHDRHYFLPVSSQGDPGICIRHKPEIDIHISIYQLIATRRSHVRLLLRSLVQCRI